MQSAPSTQTNIPIAGMKDGILILKDGSYRIVLEVAAINFDLKSEQEQNAIIFSYQSFLNSLHFPIEIVVQSKKLDLSPYLKKIKGLSEKQTNELIKIQTIDYVDFVEQLINLANIMKKKFYVVVGYTPITVSDNFIDKLFKRNTPTTKLRISETDFQSYAKELRQRAQTAAQGLGSIGLHCKQLTTQEIIELFYEIYNPEVAGKERLTDSDDVSGSYVTQMKPKSDEELSAATQQVAVASGSPDQIIDNSALVSAKQQEQNRQIALENAKQDGAKDAGPAKSEEAKDEPLPGETPAEPAAAKPAAPEEQYDNANYGS